MKEREYDLKDRLIDFSVRIIRLSEALPDSKAGKHIQETDELISILFKGIETAKKNKNHHFHSCSDAGFPACPVDGRSSGTSNKPRFCPGRTSGRS